MSLSCVCVALCRPRALQVSADDRIEDELGAPPPYDEGDEPVRRSSPSGPVGKSGEVPCDDSECVFLCVDMFLPVVFFDRYGWGACFRDPLGFERRDRPRLVFAEGGEASIVELTELSQGLLV